MSLKGLTILVTRPEGQAATLMSLLKDAGAEPIWFSPIKICPNLEVLPKLQEAFLAADIVFFVSPSAIDVAKSWLDFSLFKGLLVCVGKPSADKLKEVSGHDVFYPEDGSDSEAVLRLDLWNDVAGKKVLIIKGMGGRTTLSTNLKQKGAIIESLSIYQREENQLDWDKWLLLAQRKHISAICVTSSEIAQGLFKQAPKDAQQLLKSLLYLTPHARITQCLEQLGVTNAVTCKAGDESMVQSLTTLLKPI